MDTEAFWERVKLLSKEKHTTQETVAKAIGMPLSTFKTWMSKRVIPSFDYVIALSRYFGVSMEYLAYGKETAMSAKIKEAQISLKATGDKLKEMLRAAHVPNASSPAPKH